MDIRRELKLFNWHKDTRTLTACISDLDIPGEMPFYITIDNPNTNQSRVFRYKQAERDKRENELRAWHYENLSHSLKLTIWND